MKPYSQHQIEELLNKFMEGNTTIEEESLLSEYFSTASHIPAEWADYKAMFGYLDRGLEGDLLPESASHASQMALVDFHFRGSGSCGTCFRSKGFEQHRNHPSCFAADSRSKRCEKRRQPPCGKD